MSEETTRRELVPQQMQAPLALGATMRTAHQLKALDSDNFAKPREVIEASYVNGANPSLAVRRAVSIMCRVAAGDAWEVGREYRATRRELFGHRDAKTIGAELDEIQRILIRVTWQERKRDEKGHEIPDIPPIVFKQTVSFITDRMEVDEIAQEGIIRWRFHPTICRIFGVSNQRAVLNLTTLLKFESKYTATLYELAMARIAVKQPTWMGTVEELRDLIGAPIGSYRDWTDLWRFALAPAILEINQLAPFTVKETLGRSGRKVARVLLTFERKNAKEEFKAYQKTLTKGRESRRALKAERVDEALRLLGQKDPEREVKIRQSLARANAGLPEHPELVDPAEAAAALAKRREEVAASMKPRPPLRSRQK